MENNDQVIIDGNAVYEIDHNCKSQIRSTEHISDPNKMFLWMLLIMLLM